MENSAFPRRIAGLGALAASFILAASSGARGDSILYDNLNAATDSTSTVADDTWFAASFGTGEASAVLQSVTLLIGRSSIGGAVQVDVYGDGGLEPGSPLATLIGPPTIPTALGEVTFSSTGLALAANATYWVVAHAPTGSFDWAWTDSNTGAGPGFQTTWSESDDAGSSWFTADSYPFQMRVTAVPEPSSMALAGLAGIAWLAFRRHPRG